MSHEGPQYAQQENIENGTTATIVFHFERHSAQEPQTRVPNGTEPLENRQPSEGLTEPENAGAAGVSTWDGERLWLANVGDSRAVLCRGGAVALASVDHDLTQQAERQRCEALGARVMETAGCLRLVPPEGEPSLLVVKGARRLTLNMSRALGHRILSGYGISAIPQLYELPIKKGDRLVIASDGLWDVLSNELVASMLTYQSCPADAVTALFNEAMDHYTVTSAAADNISLLVLFFD